MMPRFSLKWFLLFVAAVCVSVAALASTNDWWNVTLRTAILLLLCFGCTYIAVGGKRRAFWIGFVVFVLLNLVPMKFMPWLNITPLEDFASAAFAIYYPTPSIAEQSVQQTQSVRGGPVGGGPQSPRYYRSVPFKSHFEALSLLWLGALGGWVGRMLSSRKDAR